MVRATIINQRHFKIKKELIIRTGQRHSEATRLSKVYAIRFPKEDKDFFRLDIHKYIEHHFN